MLYLKVLYRWKHGKSPPAGSESNKPALLSAWHRTKDKDDDIATWSELEESQLVRLQSEIIGIHDTEVGRQTSGLVHGTISALSHMTKECILKHVSSDEIDRLKMVLL